MYLTLFKCHLQLFLPPQRLLKFMPPLCREKIKVEFLIDVIYNNLYKYQIVKIICFTLECFNMCDSKSKISPKSQSFTATAVFTFSQKCTDHHHMPYLDNHYELVYNSGHPIYSHDKCFLQLCDSPYPLLFFSSCFPSVFAKS